MVVGSLAACNDEPANDAAGSAESDAATAALQADALGDDFVDAGPDAVTGTCLLEVDGAMDASAESYVSQAAQQLVDVTVYRFETSDEAERAFEDALETASCQPSEFGDGGGAPTALRVPHADNAFSMDFADSVGAVAVAMARRDEALVVVETEIHEGASTDNPIGALVLVAAVVAGLA